ncbi:hypothetical protein D3C87_82020 [compost metagenome]
MIVSKDVPITYLNRRFLFDNFELEKKIIIPEGLTFNHVHQILSEYVFMKYKNQDTLKNPHLIEFIKKDVAAVLNELDVRIKVNVQVNKGKNICDTYIITRGQEKVKFYVPLTSKTKESFTYSNANLTNYTAKFDEFPEWAKNEINKIKGELN